MQPTLAKVLEATALRRLWRRSSSRSAGVGVVLLMLFAVAGCRRRAPGPEECRRLALGLHGLRSERDLARFPHARHDADEITRECLVTPYDREMLRCLEEGGRFRSCRTRLAQRNAEGK